jgi:hypothetical protein
MLEGPGESVSPPAEVTMDARAKVGPWRRRFRAWPFAVWTGAAILGACSGTTSDVPGGSASCPTDQTACDGVCVRLETDPAHCGACGTACSGGTVCDQGTCALSCGGGTTACGVGCVDTALDPAHCGGCNKACAPTEVCAAGACALACPGGTTACGGGCVDTTLDPAHCGGCDKPCAAGEVCSMASCGIECAGGTVLCGKTCVSLASDWAHCGTCGKACAQGEACIQGSCKLQCAGGTTLCNGKCVDTALDPAHCGGCNKPCAGGLVCAGGVCALQCAGGTTLCGTACVDTMNDPKHCGACKKGCPGFCAAGTCSLGSPTMWLDAGSLAGVSDGDTVSLWPDQSGNGIDAEQLTAARRPVYKTNVVGGRPVLRFDGADDALGFKSTQVLTALSAFIVYRFAAGATATSYYPLEFGGDLNVTGQYWGIETLNGVSGSSPHIADVLAGFSNDARATGAGVSSFDEWKVVSAVSEGMIHNTTLRVNGVAAAMSTTGSNVALAVQIGNATGTGWGGVGGIPLLAFGQYAAKADVAEVILYASVLPPASRAAVEGYLMSKYGLGGGSIVSVAPSAFAAPTTVTFTGVPGASECNDITGYYGAIKFFSAQGFRDVNTGFASDGESGSSATCSTCSNAVRWFATLATPAKRFGMYYAVGYGEASTVEYLDANGVSLGSQAVANGQAFVGAEATTSIKYVVVTPTGTGHCIDNIVFE